MERKIGETFEYEGKKLQVVETASNFCFGCYFFDGVNCQRTEREGGGECYDSKRADYKPVIFVEVKDGQPQLNLCEILKHCPQGETFWSPMLDGVKFSCIDEERQMIIVETIEGHFTWEINADGTISIDEVTSPEVMLYPSKEMRDWSKFTAPWLKKERFDPKTLKPFDKVLGGDYGLKWGVDFFSHTCNDEYHPYRCVGNIYKYCIPYNDDTKHLVGTKDEAPVFYRYWED